MKRVKPEVVAGYWCERPGEDQPWFRQDVFPVKGRGVIALKYIPRGEFLLLYDGELVAQHEGNARESTDDESTFRFFFSFKGKKWCIDATSETLQGLGRLVNHSKRCKNARMRVIEKNGRPYLCLFSIRDIYPNEEILYDYGIEDLPWEDKMKFVQEE